MTQVSVRGQWTQDPGRTDVVLQVQRQEKADVSPQGCQAGGTPFTHRRLRPFVLCEPLADWMRPTHMEKGNLLYSAYRFRCSFLPEITHKNT